MKKEDLHVQFEIATGMDMTPATLESYIEFLEKELLEYKNDELASIEANAIVNSLSKEDKCECGGCGCE